MLTKKILTVLAAASLTCLTATPSWAAQTAVSSIPPSTTSTRAARDDALVSRYTKLAGSTANAQSLVTGLRTGSVVTLTATGSAPAVSFAPATQKMGFGNINIALALAKTALAKQGITNPTPEQLAAALNGGNITLTNGSVVTLAGVLTQRSAGMGWGNIAKTLGVKQGAVVSASKTDKAGKEDALAKTDDDSKKNNVAKVEKSEKVEKPEKADKDDKKDTLAKAETAKIHSTSSEGGASNSKSSSSANSGGAGGGGGSASSHSGGGGKSSSGGGSSGGNGGGNSGGNGGGNSGGNSGGNGGGGKK